jgi:hypothetical protein
MLEVLFVYLVVLLGFVLGSLIRRGVPEEEKDSLKYRRYIEIFLLFGLIFFLIGTFFTLSWQSFVFFAVGLALTLLVKRTLFYIGFALLSFNLVAASFCFVYGLSTGIKDKYSVVFFLLPFVLFFVPFNFAPMIAVGGFVGLLVRCLHHNFY